MDIAELLAYSVKNKASDLHLSSGLPPMVRVDGDVRRLNVPALENKILVELLYSTMNDHQRRDFEAELEVDFSYSVPGLARFRVNCFHKDGGVGAVFRTIPIKVLTLEELGAPPSFKQIIQVPRGLVLVTGPTGSGKSTTLAAMIDYLNGTMAGHILTVEDPIEFVHNSRKCLINQREVHRDTLGFNEALRSALREDPDTILVGEMRDLETIRLALTAAETGHLVLGTLHTSSAPKTVDRIIDAFPPNQQAQIRTQLAESLEGVLTQTLLKKKTGGRVVALEILVGTTAVRNLIREGKLHQIPGVMQASQREGMQTLDMALVDLATRGLVTKGEAQSRSSNPNLFGAAAGAGVA